MLLRRITKHVKDQNWFAVGIDFAIVVIGVFVGIQVANWNDQAAQRQLGKDYERRIVSDLTGDLAVYETLAVYYGTVLENVLEADRLLAAPDPDPLALLVATYRASEIINESANRATWDQIVSSGHLGLLPDRVLEGGLADYYRNDEASENNGSFRLLPDSPYRRRVRSIIPLPVQLEIRAGCSDVTNELNSISGFAADCQLNIDSETLIEVAEALKSSDLLKADLRYQYTHVFNTEANARGSVILVQRVLSELQAEGQ